MRITPLRKSHKNKGFLKIRIFPFESDKKGGQASIFLYYPIYKKSIIFSGFIDFNFKEYNFNTIKIVAEPALLFKLKGNMFLMIEGRWNQFEEDHFEKKGGGVAIGLKYNL